MTTDAAALTGGMGETPVSDIRRENVRERREAFMKMKREDVRNKI